ncbi:MAG: hypothetical protein RL404_2258 [Pseudomonadota bacterium]
MLPIDILKVDQSFIRDIRHERMRAAIVEGIIAIGRSLGLEVVAEWVDSPEALDFLRPQHYTRSQRFHFARPIPAAEFERWCLHRPA